MQISIGILLRTLDYFHDPPVAMIHWRVIVLTVLHVFKTNVKEQN